MNNPGPVVIPQSPACWFIFSIGAMYFAAMCTDENHKLPNDTEGPGASRRDFLRRASQTAAAVAAAPLVAACSSDGASGSSTKEGTPYINFNKTYRWKLVTTWPPNFPILGEGCTLFAEKVREMSGGRMEVEVYGGGELVPALEAFEAVSTGGVELGHAAPYYWAGKAPASQLFAGVPFGMNAQTVNAWLQSGGGMALWEETYAPFGITPLLSGNTGCQMGGWYNREINAPADVQGLKKRIPGLGGKVFTKSGGTSVLVAGGEIYTNLERGVIDATEWIGPYHDYKMGFHEIAKYYYYPGWHEPGTVFEMFANTEKLAELPTDLQAIIRVAVAWQNSYTLAEFERQNALYLQKILDEGQVELREFPTEVLAMFRTNTREVLAELVEDDAHSRKVLSAYEAFRREMAPWSAITEQAYYKLIKG